MVDEVALVAQPAAVEQPRRRRFGVVLTSDALAVLAIGCIATACTWGPGFQVPALALLMAAMVLCGSALAAPRGKAALPIWATVALVEAFGMREVAHVRWLWVLLVAAPAAVLLSRRRIALLLLAAAAAATARSLVLHWTWGAEGNDVFRFTQTAAHALLHGHSPYGPATPAYVEGVSWNYPVHFPYGPSIVLLSLPGRLLGDVRASSLVLLLVLFGSVLLLAHRSGMSRGELVRLGGLLLAFPLTVVMITSAFVETYSIGLLALWLVLRERHQRLAVVVLAVALATKPTIALAVLPFFLWSWPARREIVTAVVLAALLVLPFALVTGFRQFYDDVAGVHLQLFPTRIDALTVNALLHSLGRSFIPPTASVLAGIAVLALLLWRRPRDSGDLLIAGALLSTVSFLLAKEAFVNYYFSVAMLLLLAVACRGRPVDARAPRRPWPLPG